MDAGIQVKEAVAKAREFLEEIYRGEPLVNILLEEIQVSEDGKWWLVTFGFQVESERNPFKELAGRTAARRYKQIRVDRRTGEVDSMVMREGA